MDEPKSDALRDMDVEIRLDATRRKPRFIIETAEMTPELTRLIQQLTARAAVFSPGAPCRTIVSRPSPSLSNVLRA